MHVPPDYAIKDKAVITAFIQQNPFAQLVCATETFPVINHIPLLYDAECNCLWGHLAKNNPDLKHLNDSQVTAVFSGPHGYISPDWYENPGVPTWNYQTVHVMGNCRADDSVTTVKRIVDQLSEAHQASLGYNWNDDYKSSMLSAIVALKIDIESLQCQFKLNQDRSAKDQQKVIKSLQENGQHELAEAMEQTQKP